MFDIDTIKRDLRRDEGVRLKPYLCTAGKMTIGVGRNIEDIGITDMEADYLLENDIERVVAELDRSLPWWRDLSGKRQEALINMCFNMGISRLMTFRKMLGALKSGRYDDAAMEALNSKWARQVGARSKRIAAALAEG
jgi:lysozyme